MSHTGPLLDPPGRPPPPRWPVQDAAAAHRFRRGSALPFQSRGQGQGQGRPLRQTLSWLELASRPERELVALFLVPDSKQAHPRGPQARSHIWAVFNSPRERRVNIRLHKSRASAARAAAAGGGGRGVQAVRRLGLPPLLPRLPTGQQRLNLSCSRVSDAAQVSQLPLQILYCYVSEDLSNKGVSFARKL